MVFLGIRACRVGLCASQRRPAPAQRVTGLMGTQTSRETHTSELHTNMFKHIWACVLCSCVIVFCAISELHASMSPRTAGKNKTGHPLVQMPV